MEDKDKEVIVDEETTEQTPNTDTTAVETPAEEPEWFIKIMDAFADLKGDVANLIQKNEAIDSPLEETTEETAPENTEETVPEEISEENTEEEPEKEDISDMFKD